MKQMPFFTAALICICSCDKPRNDMYDYSVQPEIPMYDQLLLKGEVKTVTEIYVSDFGTSTEAFTFDETGKLIFYAYNGEELGSFADLRSILFPWICGTYANFVFPNDWTKYDNRIETKTFTVTENGIVTHEIEKKIEYEWDRSSGRFTKVRCYIDNEPVSLAGIEDGYNIEEYLYYSNGLPHHDFNFAEELCLLTELSYDGFDDKGNPLVVEVSTPNGDFTITRKIEYY